MTARRMQGEQIKEKQNKNNTRIRRVIQVEGSEDEKNVEDIEKNENTRSIKKTCNDKWRCKKYKMNKRRKMEIG